MEWNGLAGLLITVGVSYGSYFEGQVLKLRNECATEGLLWAGEIENKHSPFSLLESDKTAYETGIFVGWRTEKCQIHFNFQTPDLHENC